MKVVSSSRLPLFFLTIAQIASCACSFAGDPQSPDSVRVFRDLSYVARGHERQKLDLYVPRMTKAPLIVWIHGGGWQSHEFDVGAHLDQSSAIACGIDMFGPTDLPSFQPAGADPLIQRSGAQSIFAQLLGGSIDEKMDLARRASPVTWVTKGSAPLYILHGAKDPVIPLEQSQRLADKLNAAGVDVVMDVIDDGGHGGKEFWTTDRSRSLAEFLNRHLTR